MSRVFTGCRILLVKAAKEASGKAQTGAAGFAAAASTKGSRSGAKSGGAFSKELPVSPAMKKFLGVPEISRSAAVKKIWEYIKANDLQNPANKREINCDEKLKAIFEGKDKVGMLEIGKLLSAHFIKPN